MPDCAPLEGITVEIWQCDARGYYSGYSNATVRAPFDTIVMVNFETIFPGWYDPRVTHIHVKVSRDGQAFLTTQLYFPDELVSDIYQRHPDYVESGSCPYNLKNDSVLRDLTNETGVVLKVTRTEEKLEASVRLGIA